MNVDVPLSEIREKITVATKKQCISDLRRLAELDPSKSVTRRYYRIYGKYSEGAWDKHFGTFEEFRRTAGVQLSRHARRMETDIARHSSVERYVKMTIEKRQWGEKYLKPKGNRYQTVLVGSDIHDIECDTFWLYTFLDTAKRVQPDKIVLNGDLFDLPEFGKYLVDPREYDILGRIDWVHNFLKGLREFCPDSEIILIEGNHEYRLLRHLSEATPAMKVLLSDLHGFTVPKLLGLDKFEINYVAPADLASFNKSEATKELKRNFLIMYDFLVAHHFPEGERFGLPGFNGHHHSHHCQTHYSPVHGTFEWHQIGSGHRRSASYCNGEKWSNGFMLCHVDTLEKRCQFEYIDVTNSHAVIGGKWYEREK